MGTTYEATQFVRVFRSTLDNVIHAHPGDTISKADVLSLIALVHKETSKIINKQSGSKLELRVPVTEPLASSLVCKLDGEYGEFVINKPTKVLFKKIDGECVAFGVLVDESVIVKLSLRDAFTCINNGWRFLSRRCLAEGQFLNSQYAISD